MLIFRFNKCCKLISAVVKLLEHEADHSALSSAKLKDICRAVTSLPDTSPWTTLPLLYLCLLNALPISIFLYSVVVIYSYLRKKIVVTLYRQTVHFFVFILSPLFYPVYFRSVLFTHLFFLPSSLIFVLNLYVVLVLPFFYSFTASISSLPFSHIYYLSLFVCCTVLILPVS